MLQFEIEDEIHKFGAESEVVIHYPKEDGQYLDHYVQNSPGRVPPNSIYDLKEELAIYSTTLYEIYEMILS